MIEQLNKVLAKILFNKELKQYENAILEIQTAGEKFLGLNWNVMSQLSDQDIIALLKIGGELNVGKTIVAASLLQEEAEILEILGKEDESWRAYLKAFSLFVDILMAEPTEELKNKTVEVLSKIEVYELPQHIEEKRKWFISTQKNNLKILCMR